MTTDFTEDDAAWIDGHVAKVVAEMQGELSGHDARFPDRDRLLSRLKSAGAATIAQRRRSLSSINEVHNELCVALGILECDAAVLTLRYEPPLAGTTRTIDFVASYQDQPPCYVDVKTIAPKAIDRWEQYESAQDDARFPTQVSYTLSKEWLGGELYHNAFAARSRMLEYTLELERKVAATGLGAHPERILLVFCSNGFHWHEDELEDFVAFYVSGTHRPDDPFGKMEQTWLRDHPLPVTRYVRRFGYMARSSDAVLPGRMTWRVVPPRIPFG